MTVSFKELFYTLAFAIAAVVILYFAQGIFIPIAFALLIAFIAYPAVKWLEQKKLKRLPSILIIMVGALLVLFGVLFLFSSQIVGMAGEYNGFVTKLKSTWDALIDFLNENIAITPDLKSQAVLEKISAYFTDSSLVIMTDTIGITSSVLYYIVLSMIYAFLILFYRNHFLKALGQLSQEKHRESFFQMLKEVQEVGQKYFTGMLFLILILGILNSIGLLIIGIDYPFFFGFLAALLAIIPYIGSVVGGLIPTIYAFMSYDNYWYPLGVIIVFWVIQFIEGNFLSPKIVGGSMQINPLFSIIALIAGGMLWGIPGMIIFLPLTAMLKVVCSHYTNLKPVTMILSDKRSETDQKGLLSKIVGSIKSTEN